MPLSLATAQLHKLAWLKGKIAATVLYVMMYELDLRNIDIKTINLVYYSSTHILILRHFNWRNKSGCMFLRRTITGMTHLFTLRDCGANSHSEQCHVWGERSLHTKQTVLKICINGNIMMFVLLLISWHTPCKRLCTCTFKCNGDFTKRVALYKQGKCQLSES